jgi:hypothetical protein
MGTKGSFPGSKAARGVNLTTHLYLVPRSKKRGAIPPLTQYAFMAWCLVKRGDNFTFTLPVLITRAVIAQSVIALAYGLDDGGSRFRFPAGAGKFSLHHHVQNGSGVHPASYPMSTRGSFLGGKATRA